MPTNAPNRGLGWRRDAPDHRDWRYTAPREVVAVLPPVLDLIAKSPPPYDQLSLGSCTANAGNYLMAFDCGPSFPMFSRLMTYFNSRREENSIASDSGAELRDVMKVLAQYGVCPEADWPYDPARFSDQPPESCYTEAIRDEALTYHSVDQDLNQIRGCIGEGYPVAFGFSVFQSFMSDQVASTGVCPMPSINESMVGGHAVAAVGYDDPNQMLLVRNSWGAGWGLGGYFKMPYAYVLNTQLASDFWTIRSVGGRS